MTLRISLRDGEQLVINGAVIRSSGRSNIMVENKCSVLRGRDIMMPEDATTPARELYFLCQMAYMEPEFRQDHQNKMLGVMRTLLAAPIRGHQAQLAITVAQKIATGEFYAALADCRAMIAEETVVPINTESAVA